MKRYRVHVRETKLQFSTTRKTDLCLQWQIFNQIQDEG